MAEKHKGKRKPRAINTIRHNDGTYHHEHSYDDGGHDRYAGTSANLQDVHQHMDDHFGGPAEPEAAAPAVEAPGAAVPAAGE